MGVHYHNLPPCGPTSNCGAPGARTSCVKVFYEGTDAAQCTHSGSFVAAEDASTELSVSGEEPGSGNREAVPEAEAPSQPGR